MSFKINENYLNLKENYLFSEIAQRVKKYSEANPDKKIIRLGIGDVTLPLSPAVIKAMHSAVDEMGVKETFRGYPPEYGHDFLRNAIKAHYADNGCAIDADDIFVSDGAKSDVGNIVNILGDNTVYVPDPVYPVYMDSNIMSGRKINLMAGNEENGFLPMPTDDIEPNSVIYMCSPNNPTGAVYTKEQLKTWVDFANKNGSVIIFDSAYEAFINGDYPHSIYAVDGAKTCAVEICSFSKTAGFTGTRCGWTVVPNDLVAEGGVQVKKLWKRRQATKFNGVSYVVQRGAEAALSKQGFAECKEEIAYYMENAKILAKLFDEKGIKYFGGVSSPYIWLKCPNNMGSWEFFDYLLENVQVVGTPGEGFGECGKGYFRLTSFGSRESTLEAVERLRSLL